MMNRSFFRRAATLLLALALFALSACGSAAPKTTTPAAGQTQTAATPSKPEKTYAVDQPYTRAMLEEIPVASAENTSDELRAICLSFARMQGTIPWISANNINYLLDSGLYLKFKKGTVYGGCPYTNVGSNLYTFMDFVDEETGLLDETAASHVGDLLGNNCCTALFWAWARVSSSITFTHTQGLVPRTGVIPLGDYRIDRDLHNFAETTTEEICQENGEQKMYECYAQLLLADGMVVNNQRGGSNDRHHVMMVSQLPHVVRDASGAIDPAESYIIFVEQDEIIRPYTLENGLSLQCEGHIDSKYSFQNLFKTGYIPFTIPELVDPSSVQKASVSFSYENGESVAVKDFLAATVSSNYALSRLIVKVTDSAGTVTDYSAYVPGVAHYSVQLGDRLMSFNRKVGKGTFQVDVSVLVGSGETLPLFHGTLIGE